MNNRVRGLLSKATLVTASIATMIPMIASAQVTSATVRGRVLVEGQPAQSGTTVLATNRESGLTKRATTQASGNYVLVGLAPGTYQLKVTGPGYEQTTRAVRVQIGQTVDLYGDRKSVV